MITLPKDWADSVGLKKNDTVGLQPQPDGSMVLYPGGEQSPSASSVKYIDVDSITDRDFLYRMLVGAYIAGHDSIVLRSSTILSSMAASTASAFAQTAIGLEIMEENDDSIVINDLMDQGEMKPNKSIERMKVLVRNMLNDTMDGLESRDASLLEGMSDRDREVDRIDWLISRQVNIHQKDITISRRMGMNLCEISRCSGISRALERIGDHGVLLATNLKPLIDDPTKLDEEILSTGRKAIALVVDSVGTWSKKDARRQRMHRTRRGACRQIEGDQRFRRRAHREAGDGRGAHRGIRQEDRGVFHGHLRDRHQLGDGLKGQPLGPSASSV